MISSHNEAAAVHRAISKLIEVEQELENIPAARDEELKAAGLRHSLYRLLDIGPRDAADGVGGSNVDPVAVDQVLAEWGDGTVADICMDPLIGDGSLDPTVCGDGRPAAFGRDELVDEMREYARRGRAPDGAREWPSPRPWRTGPAR